MALEARARVVRLQLLSPSHEAANSKNLITFKNGITLIKDRRLIDKRFMHGDLRVAFNTITEENYLRVKPLISKLASEREVYSCIITAFQAKGHHLLRDGNCGFDSSGGSGPSRRRN
ncbi:hypothetical protein CF326_g3911 [Tilletia indica]|nr:hypothetical protein CF326_g3911 [Tilletia indica]